MVTAVHLARIPSSFPLKPLPLSLPNGRVRVLMPRIPRLRGPARARWPKLAELPPARVFGLRRASESADDGLGALPQLLRRAPRDGAAARAGAGSARLEHQPRGAASSLDRGADVPV